MCVCVCNCEVIFLKNYLLFLVVLHLHSCPGAFSRCSELGPLCIVVHRFLFIEVPSLVVEHELWSTWACGARS